MIVSDQHRYVYVGIPRTGSKSMGNWLIEHNDGRSHGRHHDMIIPDQFKDYFVFTLVRNPYELWVSFAFHVAWGDAAAKDDEVGQHATAAGARMARWAILENRDKIRRELVQPDTPLQERIRQARDSTNGALLSHNLDRAGVHLALYLERLPACLAMLPFVDERSVPPFLHHPERGIRPPGKFADFYPAEEEQVVWAAARRDFAALHYSRYNSGLPEDAPDAIWLRDWPSRP